MPESGRRALALRQAEQAERRAELAAADLEAALARLNATEDEPGEPPVGTIIEYRVQYSQGTTTYTYVTFRAPNGLWYRTGDTNALNWSTVLDHMYRDITAKKHGVGFYVHKKKHATWVGRVVS